MIHQAELVSLELRIQQVSLQIGLADGQTTIVGSSLKRNLMYGGYGYAK